MLFRLGHVVCTPAALEFCTAQNIDMIKLIRRHAAGDFGDLSVSDAEANVQALQHDLRVFSSYVFAGEKVWVITEADRTSTCVLLPEDY